MGVHGLWKLLEPSGQMVPLESLAGKVLAVDVSIWLHQAMKGVHDANGAPLAVAHLLILFHRLCKLLFYKIKPVFVFDGGVPALKHQTMVARRQRSTAARSEAMKVREKLIKNLLKHEAVRQMLSDETASAVLGLNSFTLPGPSVEEDLYKLPPIAADYVDSESSEASSTGDEDEERHAEDIHSIDVTSQEFLNLPAEVRHDILTELIETRKQSSWKYLEAMPKKSDSFSDFQMNRLLKRHAVQTSLEKAGKEMGGRALSLKELEALLGDRGVLDPKADLPSRRIAQDNVTRFMLVHKDGGSEKTEEEQFDIMKHLEDVEWSSESDTDVILEQKSQKGNADPIPKQSTEKEVPAVDEVKREPRTVSKQAKVRVTDEVADILMVLEDEDVSSDIKVKLESLQSQISSNENSNLSNPEDSKGVASIQLEEKPVSPETNENGKEMEWSHAHHLPEDEPCRNGNEDSSREEEDTEPKETTAVEEEMEEESKSSISNVNDEKAKGKGDSSSDSESDFIPITESRSSSPRNDTKNGGQPSEEVANESDSAGDSLTVVINPLEVEEADDLFADVFKEVDEVSDGGKDSKEGVDPGENEYKAEFEQRMSTGDLNHLKKTLEEEHDLLMREKGRQERLAANVTDHVYSDAQELLRLFGVPFVIAPMEAEAQCAALNAFGLTEGTITDDSDIWLFGGRVVYKNFFNQNKHVLEYRSENIQKYFKLSREDMIRMALLVGSDYTLGLNGVGPVTALEILAAFRGPNQGFIDSLRKFRDWFIGTSKTGPPRTTLRRKIKNAVISPGFPNVAVVEAYLHPQVDDSKEPFSWAKPNLELIRKYAKAKMGWSTEKCNEVLLPVLKKLEEKTGQTTIEKHFKIVQKSSFVEGLLSKRVENAIKRLGSESFEETTDPKPKRKRRARKADEAESASRGREDVGESSRMEKEATPGGCDPSEGCSQNVPLRSESKMKLIKEKLHKNLQVPQREMAQKLKEERKREAIQIFRTFKRGGRKKMKVFAKEEANLSESSSEND